MNAYHIISFFTHENLKRMPVWILKLILPNWAQLCSFPSCFRVRIFSLGCTVDQDLPVSWFEYNLNFQIFPNPASHVNSHYRSHWNGIASLLTYKQYFNISMSICVSSASTSASSFFFSTPHTPPPPTSFIMINNTKLLKMHDWDDQIVQYSACQLSIWEFKRLTKVSDWTRKSSTINFKCN